MFFQRKLGIDLGTANTLIYLAKKGIVLNEPSIIAFNNRTNKIISVGSQAKKIFSRAPAHITAVYPLNNGVISDFELAQEMLRSFLGKISSFSLRNLIVATIPTNLTEVERKSIEDLFKGLGAFSVYLVLQPIAAGLGANLDIKESQGYLIVDLGAGATDISLLSSEGRVVSQREKSGGNKFDEEIIEFIKAEFGLIIGKIMAEQAKIAVGSAMPQAEKLETVVRGRDLASGLPKEIVLRSSHIRLVLQKTLEGLAEKIKEVIEKAPVELVGDIYKNGIYLCGGGALLRGIDEFFQKALSINISIVEDPLGCLARGTGIIIENFGKHKNLVELFPREEIKL